MRKKIILIVIASFMIMGVVSAANLWGEYKGKQIIRLTVDGVPIKVSDAPAVLMDGRTMIPIYLLQQAGVNYSWDGKTQTVNIQKNKQTETQYVFLDETERKTIRFSFIAKQYDDFGLQVQRYTSDLFGYAIQIINNSVVTKQSDINQNYSFLDKFLDAPEGNIELYKYRLSSNDYNDLISYKEDAESLLRIYKKATDELIEADNFRKTDYARYERAIQSATTSLGSLSSAATELSIKTNQSYFNKITNVMK